MSPIRFLFASSLLCLLASTSFAQHVKVTSVAVQPTDAQRVWVCNRDNASVSVVNVRTGSVVAEIPVGVWPRSIAFTADGTKAYVANQRGNVPVEENFVTFVGGEVRGSLSVIDVASLTVTKTITDVGTGPYGVAVSPNGQFLAVSLFRQGQIRFYTTTNETPLVTHQYMRNLSFLPPGKTILDADANKDFIADLESPRGFVIRSDSARMFVTHNRSPYISVLDLTLNSGVPTAVTETAKIDTNEYPFDIFFNPVPVQTLQSQGLPRFLEDIALSPDGTRALVPHLLHNINHDVNFSFPGLAGDFANRVYPALTVLDASALSYAPGSDNSLRLHNELSDPLQPAEYVPIGRGVRTRHGIATLGATNAPTLGATANYTVTGGGALDLAVIWFGRELGTPPAFLPDLLCTPDILAAMVPNGSGSFTFNATLPAGPSFEGKFFCGQAAIISPAGDRFFTNAVRTVLSANAPGQNKLGHRAGHPSRVLYNSAGDRAVLLNRGSEDVFLYEVNGSDMRLLTAFPPRHKFVERAAHDTTTPLGDLPLGMTLWEDPATSNDDAVLYVINENTRTLSSLRIDWTTGAISQERPQIPTLTGADSFTQSERLGQEIFEDASRLQTTGNFNNSCASCHFEGADDGNVWQRPDGPRSTMPVYGGSRMTGLILWRGVRLNMGETGPMFGGENGGHGIFDNDEQLALIEYHDKIPTPLNPNLDLAGNYTGNAEFGRDLYFGENATGMNPSLRHAGCTACHPDSFEDPQTMQVFDRFYTTDFVSELLTSGDNIGPNLDPSCFTLRENIASVSSIKDVNSGVNIDFNPVDGMPDVDRNNDGFDDRETYVPMNPDADSLFTRDHPNSYLCPLDPHDPQSPLREFGREMRLFSVPTKLGVFSTGPFFHDHVASSLRMLLDPQKQQTDPVYGHASFPGMGKFINEFHDIRGDETFHQGASKVQVTLTSGSPAQVDIDVEALLEYIQSL